jgi:hypothetical protein
MSNSELVSSVVAYGLLYFLSCFLVYVLLALYDLNPARHVRLLDREERKQLKSSRNKTMVIGGLFVFLLLSLILYTHAHSGRFPFE